MRDEIVNPPRGDNWDALRSLFRFAVFAFVLGCIVLILGVGGLIYATYKSGIPTSGSTIPLLTSYVGGLGSVLSPLFQLFVVLVLVEWFLKRMGLSFRSSSILKGLEWNTQTIIAVVVITAFSIAALAGLTTGLGALKDVALVVVGFYFGTQKRVVEIESERGKIREVVEHENPVAVQERSQQGGRSPENLASDKQSPPESLSEPDDRTTTSS